MKVFWHSTSSIYDLATRARLSLAFQHVVVPSSEIGYYPHAELKKPPEPEKLRKYNAASEFWPSTARQAKPAWDYETAYENFGSEFAEAQAEIVEVKNLKFEHYLRTAALNDGVLLGNTELSDSDFKSWLTADLESDQQAKRFRLLQALLTFAGIEVALPNIAPKNEEQLLQVKEKYAEEITDYQECIAELLGGTWDFVKSDPTYDELRGWSQHVANTKIGPSLRRLDAAIRTGDRRLLDGIGYDLFSGLPNVASGAMRGSSAALLSSGLEALLKVLAPSLARSFKERRALESTFGLSYLYRLGKANRRGAV